MPSNTPHRRTKRWYDLRKRVLERDGHTCAYCGNEATEADHIVARNNGGKDEMSNLVAACRSCNGRKSDRVLIRIPYVNRRWLAHL